MSKALSHARKVQSVAPNGTVATEPNPRRIRAYFGGEVVADTTESIYVFEKDHLPAYYIPRTDVRNEFLRHSDTTSVCPRKGVATYRTIQVAGKTSVDALWTYPEPLADALDLSAYVSFYWDRVDAWFEEDEQVFVHPRDPYVRVDVLAPRADLRRRRSCRGHPSSEDPVRNRPSATVLRSADRCEALAVHRIDHHDGVPVQGDGVVRVDAFRAEGHRLVLSANFGDGNRESPVVLRRAWRSHRRRREGSRSLTPVKGSE